MSCSCQCETPTPLVQTPKGCGVQFDVPGATGSLAIIRNQLRGFRVELPSTGQVDSANCNTIPSAVACVTLRGTALQKLNITFRLRGAVETKYNPTATYVSSYLWVGGTPTGPPLNDFWMTVTGVGITVAAIRGDAFVDMTGKPLYIGALPYLASPSIVNPDPGHLELLEVPGNATICLHAANYLGTELLSDIVVPSVPPYPQMFNGQFVQFDAESVNL